MIDKNPLGSLRESVLHEKKIISEIESLLKSLEKSDSQEREVISSQIDSLKDSLKKTNDTIPAILENIFLTRPLNSEVKSPVNTEYKQPGVDTLEKVEKVQYKNPAVLKSMAKKILFKKSDLSNLEKETLKRFKKKKSDIVLKKKKKPSKYVNISNKLFFKFSSSLSHKGIFKIMNKDLIKSHLQFVPANYISTILFTTLLSIIFGIFLCIFFLFFNFGVELPIITRATEGITSRFLKVFWLVFAIPITTFLAMFFYPSMEKKSLETKINQELPFATLHMFAISGSLIDPSKIFSVIISTKEYPTLEREFTRLINEINIYGYDLVNALRSTAINTPSRKLSELFNGFATTITSGGDLREFFEKRSESLLFDYRLEREKYTKSAETFMDIYISVVIAAPMILMLLVILIKISGLGISLSTSAIVLVMVLGVSMVNILFLTFLYLKQPSG